MNYFYFITNKRFLNTIQKYSMEALVESAKARRNKTFVLLNYLITSLTLAVLAMMIK